MPGGGGGGGGGGVPEGRGRGRCMSQFCHTYLQKKEISEEN